MTVEALAPLQKREGARVPYMLHHVHVDKGKQLGRNRCVFSLILVECNTR